MFEKIILRRSDKGPGLTAGELAEALLFYQNVHIVLDFSSLKRGQISPWLHLFKSAASYQRSGFSLIRNDTVIALQKQSW